MRATDSGWEYIFFWSSCIEEHKELGVAFTVKTELLVSFTHHLKGTNDKPMTPQLPLKH